MITLGIDQSFTSTGYCLLIDNNVDIFGIVKSVKDDDIHTRCLYICSELLKLVENNNVDKLVIEGLAFGMTGSSTRDLAGLQFAILTLIKFHYPEIEISIISPKSLKLFATQDGKAKKKLMIESLPIEVLNKFKDSGLKISTGLTDVTDAYWLTKYNK